MTTDFELLDAWAAGDRDAGRTLLERYVVQLYRFFHNKLEGDVADLVQDTLLACVTSRERFRRESSFRTWLFATARNILCKRLRERHRGPDALDLERSSLRDLGPSPSAYVAHKVEHRLLLEALRSLPVEQQILMELYYFEGLTAIELAAIMDVTESALRMRLHRARAELRSGMEALAGSPDLLRSSWADFEAWARALPGAANPRGATG